MAIQVDESKADELGHVYSEGERLLCRIRLCYERQKKTQEYSKLANSGVRAHDFLKELLMTFHFDEHITTDLEQELL